MKYTLVLVALLILVLGGGYLWHKQTTVVPTPTQESTGNSYTKAQVAAHNTAGDCWSSISGNVYDLTAWISKHPGGEGPILSLCGTDGTAAFMDQHGRSSKAQAALESFKIGTLLP